MDVSWSPFQILFSQLVIIGQDQCGVPWEPASAGCSYFLGRSGVHFSHSGAMRLFCIANIRFAKYVGFMGIALNFISSDGKCI